MIVFFQRRFLQSLATATIALLITAGCSENKVEVSGRVTFDGQPIDHGTIRFASDDGQGPTAGATIKGGRYQTEVTIGPKTVQIDGYRQTGEEKQNPADPSSPMVPTYEPIVPAKFNRESTLSAEITRSQKELNFDLKSG